MTRRNFDTEVRKAAVRRAMGPNNQVYCEECNQPAKVFEIDHIIPDRLNGKPTLDNARVLCRPCHVEKTALDRQNIAKNNRLEERNLGIRKLKSGKQLPRGPKQPGARVPDKVAGIGPSNLMRRFTP